MKNKEEPSIGSASGNPSTPANRYIPGRASAETTGSIVRQDATAPASLETPALSESPGCLRQCPSMIPTSMPLTPNQPNDLR